MDFATALRLLGDLKAQGELFIALTPPFGASLEIDRHALQVALGEHHASEADFRRHANEAGIILFAILSDSVDQFIEVRMQAEDEGADAPMDRDGLEHAVAQIRDTLWDDHVQRRYDLKKSSKAPSFTNVDWDIKVKHVDGNLENFVPFPYATFRFSFQKDFDDSPFVLFGGRALDSVQINFSIDEIDHLSRVLFRVREHLETLEKGLEKEGT